MDHMGLQNDQPTMNSEKLADAYAVESIGRQTSQVGLLEGFLTKLRTRKTMPFLINRVVLDFGCGNHFYTLRSLGPQSPKKFGFDHRFSGEVPFLVDEQILIVGSLSDLPLRIIDRIVALACFEHIEPPQLVSILGQLSHISTPDAEIVGTMPTPAARPILEFLSFRLGVIDPSQIQDHKIYYELPHFQKIVGDGGWKLVEYQKFQFGWNSFFRLQKK